LDRERIERTCAWGLLALVLVGAVWFGAVEPEIKPLFASLALVLGAVVLLTAPVHDRPGRGWLLVALAFPLWLGAQVVSLPSGVVGVLSPTAARWWRELWPGPLTACDGSSLVAATPPGWLTLSVDRYSTWPFLFIASAALVVFLASRASFGGDRPAQRRVLGVVAVFTAIESLYGLLQWRSARPLVLWLEKEAYLESATGTLINRNHFALMLYVGLGCTLALALDSPSRRAAESRDPGREIARSATLAFLAGLQIFAILATKSRAGLAGMLMVGVVGLALLVGRKERRGQRAVALLLVAMLVLPALYLAGPALLERHAAIGDEWTAEAGRGAVWRATLRMVADFPLVGSGGASFGEAFRRYRTEEIRAFYDYAHNDYLQVLAETGLPGLVFALLPVLLVAVPVARGIAARRSGRTGPGSFPSTTTWPVWAALLAVALHEFVDFGLQIPSNLLLVALLAGVLSPPSAGTGILGRPAPALNTAVAVAALGLSVPALLLALAQWSFLDGKVPFPDLPSTTYSRSIELSRAFRKDSEDVDLICGAISGQAQAQVLRPLAAGYAIRHATDLLLALDSGAIPPERRTEAMEEATRIADRARRVDPWHAVNRRSLVGIDLSLAEIGQALEDASVAARLDPDNVSRIVRTLLDTGIPGPMIAERITEDPRVLRELLSQLAARGDDASRGIIVGKEVRADLRLCRAGGEVRNVLVTVHAVDGEPFLRECLRVLEKAGDEQHLEYARAWLANDLLESGRAEEAGPVIASMRDDPTRWWPALSYGMKTQSWDVVITNGRKILRDANLPSGSEAYVRACLTAAFANQGDFATAIAEAEKALAVDPSQLDLRDKADSLRRGKNPFQSR